MVKSDNYMKKSVPIALGELKHFKIYQYLFKCFHLIDNDQYEKLFCIFLIKHILNSVSLGSCREGI